ncbi:MAG: hypothetical protein N3G20_08255 [Verrucomicrobiae bacterium]|nr:hypothetical protein [Verrucomicrobiae bacterium]
MFIQVQMGMVTAVLRSLELMSGIVPRRLPDGSFCFLSLASLVFGGLICLGLVVYFIVLNPGTPGCVLLFVGLHEDENGNRLQIGHSVVGNGFSFGKFVGDQMHKF